MKHKEECGCGLCRVKAERQQALEARQKGLKAPRWETKVGDPKPPTPKAAPRCDCSTCRFSRQQAAGGPVAPDPWQAITAQMLATTANFRVLSVQIYSLTSNVMQFTTGSARGSQLNELQQSCSGEPFEFAAGALTLWRRFTVGIAVDGDVFLYGAQQNLWTTAEMTAECRPRGYLNTGHEAPDESCACGIYAFNSPDIEASGVYRRPSSWGLLTVPSPTEAERLYASAVVECWGNILIGSKGVRAQKVRIVALHVEGSQRPEMTPDPAVLQALSTRYPDVKIYPTHAEMLATHPLSDLPGEA